MRIPLGDFKPDQPDLSNDGLEEALNCIPRAVGYGPFSEPAAFSATLSESARSAYSTRSTDGTVSTFAGSEKNLYKSSDTAWSNVTRTATYTTAAEHIWNFTTFGDTVLGCNGSDAMQIFTLGSSTQFLDQSASASAPVAHYITTVGDFAMVARVASNENRVQWCRINNVLRWDVSAQFQSDFNDLAGTGRLRGITGGDFACILAERSIWRADYVGSPLIFAFDEMAPGIGCDVPGSVARFQNLTFFYSPLGFYVFDGTQALPIGVEKIDDDFAEDLNRSFLFRVSSVIDPINRIYILSYPSNASADGTPDMKLIYYWPTGKWSQVKQSVNFIFQGIASGYTLEGLDAVSSSIDALPFSLDSRAWQGGEQTLAGFSTENRWVTFDGDAKTAQFITGEGQLFEDRRAFISNIRPLVQGNGSTAIEVRIGERKRLIDSVTFGTASPMNSQGYCPVLSSNRYHRLRMDVSAGFTRAMGFDVTAVDDGEI